jgi:hypothetical protein
MSDHGAESASDGRGDRPGDGDTSGVVPVPAAADDLGGGFVPEQRLADLLFRKRLRRVGPGLVSCDGRSYRLCEAVRIVDCDDDDSDLTGTVSPLADLLRAGATFSGRSMQLRGASYLVERGVLAMAQRG